MSDLSKCTFLAAVLQKQPPKQTCFEFIDDSPDFWDFDETDYYDYWNDGYWQDDEVAEVAEVAQGKTGKV